MNHVFNVIIVALGYGGDNYCVVYEVIDNLLWFGYREIILKFW